MKIRRTLKGLGDMPSGFNSAAYAQAMNAAVVSQSGGTDTTKFDPNALANTSGTSVQNVIFQPQTSDDTYAWVCAFTGVSWGNRGLAIAGSGTPVDPKLHYSTDGAPTYGNLSATPTIFANASIDKPILQPHFTTALDWCLPAGQSGVLNIGNPVSQYDTIEFLRSALIDSDWNRVYYWFLCLYAQVYKAQGLNKNYFFTFADMNILQYKYVIENGRKVYYPFSLYDIKKFLNLIVSNFTIADLTHSRTTCSIGLINWNVPEGTPGAELDPASAQNWNDWRTQLVAGLVPGYDSGHGNGASSVFQYESMVDLVKTTEEQAHSQTIPCGNFRVGWIQGLRGDWTTTRVVTLIIVILASYGVGYAAAAADAATTATTAAATVPAVTSAATAVGGSTAVTTALVDTALDEVIVTGIVSSVSAATVAATTAGIALATVPVAVAATAPAASSTAGNSLTSAADNLDEIVITGTANATTLSSATTGAVLASATTPVIASTSVASAPASTNTAPNSNDNLDEVVVNGTRTATVISSPTTGAILASATVPVATSAVSNAASESTNSASQSSHSNQPKTLKDYLTNLVEKYGLAYAQKYLRSLLTSQLGRAPTAAELAQANQILSDMAGVSGGATGLSNAGWIIALIGAGFLLTQI